MEITTISPAHAQLVLRPDAPARDALRIALLHLITLDHLRAENVRKRGLLGETRSVRLGRGAGREPLPEELAVVLDALFPPGQPPKLLSQTEFVYRVQRRFGADYEKYTALHLRPSLMERGWMREEVNRVLGLIPRRSYPLTPQGERMKTHLEELLQSVNQVPDLLETDPRLALQAVAALGPLVLLSDSVRPHLAALAEAAHAEPGVRVRFADPLADLEEQERYLAWLDGLEVLTIIDWAGVLDAVDGLGDGGGDCGDGGE